MSTTVESRGRTDGLLREAIIRNCGVMLSLPSAGMLRHYRSRFLAEASGHASNPFHEPGAAEGAAFWLESVPSERPLLDELVATQHPVGVSFKAVNGLVSFAVPIRRRETEFRMNGATVVEAILMPFPPQVKTIQRRGNYRVRVPDHADLAARVWRIDDGAPLSQDPPADREIPVRLRDISVGGVGVLLSGVDGKPPGVDLKARLRVELRFGETTLLLQGRLRYPHPPTDEPVVRAGLHFDGLEGDLDGRRKLAQLSKIVALLQREEVRRARLGI
jgi:hypothetical protein